MTFDLPSLRRNKSTPLSFVILIIFTCFSSSSSQNITPSSSSPQITMVSFHRAMLGAPLTSLRAGVRVSPQTRNRKNKMFSSCSFPVKTDPFAGFSPAASFKQLINTDCCQLLVPTSLTETTELRSENTNNHKTMDDKH